MAEEIMKGSQAEVGRYLPELSLDIIKKFICPTATDQEAYVFLQLCKIQKLNPFLREVYLIKFGKEAATTVVAKDAFLKRAGHVPAYAGFKAGIIIVSHENIIYREGSFTLEGEILLGGWAEVYRKDRTTTFRNEVSLQDFSKHVALWKTMPSVMIRKVALVQSLREAFPDEFGGQYGIEEIPFDGELPTYEIGKHPDIAYSGKPFVEPPQMKADTGGEATTDNEIITSIEKIEEIKSKPDAKKAWTAYILICVGKKYGTYDKDIYKVASAAMAGGQQVRLVWKQGKHNPEIVSLNIVEKASDGDIRDGELLPQDDKELVTSTKLSAANFLTILKTCKTLANINKAWNEYWNEGYSAEEKGMLLEWKDKLTEGLKK